MSRKNQPINTTDTMPTGSASTLRRWVIHTDHSDVVVPTNSTGVGVICGAKRSAANQ